MDRWLATQIFLVSCFFSFGVQTLAYLYYRYINHQLIKAHKSVVGYWSGIVGDGVLVPGVNVFCVMTIYYLGSDLNNFNIWPYSLIGGIFITFVFHYYQERWKLTNWTMPSIGLWNLLGVYHAIFMFCESSFLVYTLLTIIGGINSQGVTVLMESPLKYILLVLGLFLISFLYDYRGAFKINVLRRG